MKKTKAKRKTLKQIRQEYYDNQQNLNADVTSIEGQCGMKLIYNLGGNKTSQIATLLGTFFGGLNPNHNLEVSQVLITDTTHSTDWAKSKKHASFKGPITVNPNTGNKIRVWIFKVTDIVKIYNSK